MQSPTKPPLPNSPTNLPKPSSSPLSLPPLCPQDSTTSQPLPQSQSLSSVRIMSIFPTVGMPVHLNHSDSSIPPYVHTPPPPKHTPTPHLGRKTLGESPSKQMHFRRFFFFSPVNHLHPSTLEGGQCVLAGVLGELMCVNFHEPR